MALKAKHNENTFGVGDEVRVHIKVTEGEKTRNQFFDGMVIGIKGRDAGKSFTVRKMGSANVGVEMIFPLNTPSVQSVTVTRTGTEGANHAKLYYIRSKSPREIEKIFSRAKGKNAKQVSKKKTVKKVESKKVVKKVASEKKTVKKASK